MAAEIGGANPRALLSTELSIKNQANRK